MIINGATCNLTNVTGPTDIAIPPVASTPPNITTVTLQSTTGAIVDANLSCLGAWVTTVFRVNPNYDPTVAANSQAYLERSGYAQRGGHRQHTGAIRDLGHCQLESSHPVGQMPAGATWAAPSVPDRNRIKAIHIAVVARNGLLEKDNVTSACTTVKGTANNGPCAWDDSNLDAAPAIDLSNDPNWQHYRYRVFETIIPLRNMIWAKDTL